MSSAQNNEPRPEPDEPESTLEAEPEGPYTPHQPVPDAEAVSAGTPVSVTSADTEEHSTLEDEPEGEPMVRVDDAVDRGSVRRAPRYGRFAFVGLLLGVLLAFGIYQLPIDPMTNARALLLMLVILLGAVGLGAGYVLALVLDRRSLRDREER